jgi:disulfide bond formation protein DsbB
VTRFSALVVLLVAFSPGGALAFTSSAAASGGVAADFNRDGFADLAIGVHGETVSGFADAGAVNVLYGSASGLTAVGDQLWHQDSPGVEDMAEAGDEFGASLAAGDFNGDGIADLAVGVRFEDVNGLANAGAVNVLYGSASGLTAAGNQFWHQDSTDIEDVAEAGDEFGSALASANFGKGRRADLAIGAPGEDVGTPADAGAVNVLYGSASGLTAAGDQFWHQDSPGVQDLAETGDFFGNALAAANFGKGTRADLAVGAAREDVDVDANAGAVNVFYGSDSGLRALGNQFWSQDSPGVEDDAEPGDNFGSSLAGANFGKGTRADLAVGVIGEDIDVNADAGAVNVFYGSDSGLRALGNQFWSQDSPGVEEASEGGDLFGVSLAAANYGKSSQADLAIGVGHETLDTDASAGGVNVLYGSDSGLRALGNQFWSQDSPDVEDETEAGDNFGYGLTGLNFGKGTRADLAAGVSQEDVATVFDAGAVNVIYGSASGLTAVGNQFWHQDSTDVEDDAEMNDEFGLALAARNYGNRPFPPF